MTVKNVILNELISREQIEKRVDELAEQINNDFKGKTVALVCILKGGVMFTADLAKRLTIDVELDFLDVSSYGDETYSSGVIKIQRDLEYPIKGKNVLIVEDIIDTGRTLSLLVRHLKAQQPESVKICTMLSKPSRRIAFDAEPDYCGYVIHDTFVVGYGLDYAQKYRNLPYIASVSFSNAN